ncbi:hypothetical protein DFH08DRAFT_812663 [Mycena albidolilacea]|uniref:Uncharacterized protein n=1 Tax=Mycena albidolilacea TaxID=1033008 RepID=A0AAD6ZTU5_9AGAR|nr:hypothetical protein DFH08DRAFT_812663 [Mycena albidolilacea]
MPQGGEKVQNGPMNDIDFGIQMVYKDIGTFDVRNFAPHSPRHKRLSSGKLIGLVILKSSFYSEFLLNPVETETKINACNWYKKTVGYKPPPPAFQIGNAVLGEVSAKPNLPWRAEACYKVYTKGHKIGTLSRFGCRARGRGAGGAVAGDIVNVVRIHVAGGTVAGGAVAHGGVASATPWARAAGGAVEGEGGTQGGDSGPWTLREMRDSRGQARTWGKGGHGEEEEERGWALVGRASESQLGFRFQAPLGSRRQVAVPFPKRFRGGGGLYRVQEDSIYSFTLGFVAYHACHLVQACVSSSEALVPSYACGGTAQDLATHPVPGRRDGGLDPLNSIRRRARKPCKVRVKCLPAGLGERAPTHGGSDRSRCSSGCPGACEGASADGHPTGGTYKAMVQNCTRMLIVPFNPQTFSRNDPEMTPAFCGGFGGIISGLGYRARKHLKNTCPLLDVVADDDLDGLKTAGNGRQCLLLPTPKGSCL